MKKIARKAAPESRAPAQYTMKTLDQVRILAHPLRLRLLEAFATGPITTRQLAAALGVPATRLYHHVNALEKVGLIRLRETRPVRGTIEKYYEAVARRMVVEAGLFSEGNRAGLNDVLSSVIEEARHDLVEAMGRSTREDLRPLALRGIVSATPAQLAALRAKLLKILKQPLGARPVGRAKAGEAKARITLVFTVEPGPESKPARSRRKTP